MLTLYGAKTFNAVKVVLTAEEAALEYDYKNLDFTKGEHKNPDYMKINPFGKVPTITHNGNAIFESNTICRYLAKIGENDLYSDDPLKAAEIDQMIDFIGYHVGHWVTVYFFQEIVKKAFGGYDANPKKIAKAGEMLKELLPYLDGILSKDDFLCGDRITVADTVAFAMFMVAEYTTFDFAAYSNICRWYEAMKARPSYKVMMSHIPGGYNFGPDGSNFG